MHEREQETPRTKTTSKKKKKGGTPEVARQIKIPPQRDKAAGDDDNGRDPIHPSTSPRPDEEEAEVGKSHR